MTRTRNLTVAAIVASLLTAASAFSAMTPDTLSVSHVGAELSATGGATHRRGARSHTPEIAVDYSKAEIAREVLRRGARSQSDAAAPTTLADSAAALADTPERARREG